MPDSPPPLAPVVVLIGNPHAGSRTSNVAAAVVDEYRTQSGDHSSAVRTIELADAVSIGFDETAVPPRAPQPDALDAVTGARLLIVATPSYKGSYTGLLKVFLDRVVAGALAGATALPVVIAGSPLHLSRTASDLTTLLRELGADVPTTVDVLESALDTAAPVITDAVRTITAHLLQDTPTA